MHDWICKVALYRLCTPIHPRTLLHIPSAPLYRLCTPIYPRTFYIYPLLPCIVLLLPYIPLPSTYPLYSLVSSLYSHISPYPSSYLLYSLVLVVLSLHSHISLWIFTFPLYIAFYLFSYNTLMNLQGNGLGNSPVKPRSKRSYHHRHSTKLSIKDLALELAKKHVSTLEPR